MPNYKELTDFLNNYNSAVVAYSGGVDSTLLAKASLDAHGELSKCVLASSCLQPESKTEEAVYMANEIGLDLQVIELDALSVEHVPENTPDRCYYCKKHIYKHIIQIAGDIGYDVVLDGANTNDESDYRPGSKASRELGVVSPFQELGWTKEHIRAISRDLELETWNKPSYACLASRVPYGISLTRDILLRVEKAEDILARMGFKQFRVRHHGDLARIEIMINDFERLMLYEMRKQIIIQLKSLGYTYVTLDLQGYRTGSLNEAMEKDKEV